MVVTCLVCGSIVLSGGQVDKGAMVSSGESFLVDRLRTSAGGQVVTGQNALTGVLGERI